MAVGLSGSVHGELVDNVSYDEAGRMTAMRLPAASGLWRTQTYYPWTVRRNGGMLESLKVGLSESGGERLSRSYAYNSFGDITALTEETTSYTFGYDGLGRLTSAYGRSYSYDGANRLTTFNGQSYGYYDAGPYHAVDRIGDFDRLDYDANGNMVTRNKGLDSQQTLVWNAENRLSQVQDNDGDMVEQYWYGLGGARVKKTSGSTTTYTFFGHYEEEVTGGETTAISHYSFGGLRIAVKRGSTLYHLHGDHLGSTSLTTAGSVVEASRAYYAYGSERAASGDLQTDRTFTGQKRDSTGLMYYNARYYDPALGTFISPDSMVPGAGQVINYNRFLYARGNPLKYRDPTGHDPLGPAWVQEFKDNHGGRAPTPRDRFDRVVSLSMSGPVSGRRTWTDRDWQQNAITPVLTPAQARSLAGIKVDDESWNSDPDNAEYLAYLTEGVLRLGVKLGRLIGGDAKEGLAHLGTFNRDGVTWKRGNPGSISCQYACTAPDGTEIHFGNKLPTVALSSLPGIAVHEMAHVIEFKCQVTLVDCQSIMSNAKRFRGSIFTLFRRRYLSVRSGNSPGEYWAEAVAVWVLGSEHTFTSVPLDINERTYIGDIYAWVEGVLAP